MTAAAAPAQTKPTKAKRRGGVSDWRPIVRDNLASIGDVVGDWYYYLNVVNNTNGMHDDVPTMYTGALLALTLLSTGLLILLFLQTLLRCFGQNHNWLCGCTMNKIIWVGIALEDLPQFILTYLIDVHVGGEVTPEGMLNFSSSMFNFLIRITDRYPEDWQDGSDEEEETETELTERGDQAPKAKYQSMI